MDIDNFSNDESDLEIYLDLNLIGQFCSKIQSLSVEMAFVDFKSDKTERSSIFQKLTELHLKGNKYRDVSVLPSLLAGTPSLARLSIQVAAVIGNSGPAVLSEEMLTDLLGRNALKGLEEITLAVVEAHHGGPQLGLGLSSLTLTSLLSHCPRLELIGDLSRWDLEDREETMDMLSTHWAWTKDIVSATL